MSHGKIKGPRPLTPEGESYPGIFIPGIQALGLSDELKYLSQILKDESLETPEWAAKRLEHISSILGSCYAGKECLK